jgi:hypothetical protein
MTRALSQQKKLFEADHAVDVALTDFRTLNLCEDCEFEISGVEQDLTRAKAYLGDVLRDVAESKGKTVESLSESDPRAERLAGLVLALLGTETWDEPWPVAEIRELALDLCPDPATQAQAALEFSR